VDELEFAVIRDTLGVSDPTLSKHLKVLAEAGLVGVRKETSSLRSDARRLTWVSLTAEGATALRRHMAALAAIAG
jgi:DNA-binding MarR family transcriptional regulator